MTEQPIKSDEDASFADALEAAVHAERAGQSHGAIGSLLRDQIKTLRKEAVEDASRGDVAIKRIARGADEILKELFKHAPSVSGDVAICAVGGYGRKELAPYSDIDLLFLYHPSVEAGLSQLMDFILYPLWDSGCKIGHSVHTPKTAVQFAKDDMIARTAFLDARYLCGSRKLFDEFQNGYERLRKRTKNQFVAAKLEEQGARQTRAHETRYLVEPDIKEGKGGLRDLQTIRWIYKYVYGGEIGENKNIDKILDASERRSLAKAERFLWSVRVHLHDIRGRADEHLTFDVQPEIAERLDYADRSDITAAERLMKHYFLNTVEVGRLTRVLCAKLEEERTKITPRLPKLLPKAFQTDEAPGKPNIRIRNGRLDFESAAKAKRQPRDFFRLFRAFSKAPKFDFHPDALAIVSEHVPKVTSDVRRDPVVAKLFEAILTDAADPVRVLRVMTETGLLGKYIPAYGAIVGRIDYGLYRRYTIDEHVLRSVGMLSSIRSKEFKDEHPITTKIISRAKNPFMYFLAVFLHEAVWSIKDRSAEKCGKLVERVTKRLGLSEDEAALAGWAVAHHEIMIRTAERRNLTDAQAISTFAKFVGDKHRLDLMLVIAVCNLRIVGLHSWDEVTRRQLTELYEATLAWFTEGEGALRQRLSSRAALARSETKTRLADWSEEEKENFLRRLTDAMLRSIDPDILVRFAYLTRAAESDRADAAVTVTPRDNDFEAIIYADDRPGLLADMAGAVAASGLSVRSVQALTTEDGKALDVFTIQSVDGAELDDVNQARRLHGELLSAARTAPENTPSFRRRLGDRRSIFTVAPAVRIDLEASADATIIEAEGLDRPGLLYELATTLSGLGLSIASAHIATYGERAVDAFYLRDREGLKIEDPETLLRIEKELMEVLSAG